MQPPTLKHSKPAGAPPPQIREGTPGGKWIKSSGRCPYILSGVEVALGLLKSSKPSEKGWEKYSVKVTDVVLKTTYC